MYMIFYNFVFPNILTIKPLKLLLVWLYHSWIISSEHIEVFFSIVWLSNNTIKAKQSLKLKKNTFLPFCFWQQLFINCLKKFIPWVFFLYTKCTFCPQCPNNHILDWICRNLKPCTKWKCASKKDLNMQQQLIARGTA